MDPIYILRRFNRLSTDQNGLTLPGYIGEKDEIVTSFPIWSPLPTKPRISVLEAVTEDETLNPLDGRRNVNSFDYDMPHVEREDFPG